jgi:hypothetical protein
MSRILYPLMIVGLLLGAGTAARGQGLKGEYFKGTALSGAPVLTRIENVNFNWGGNAPDPVVGADTFSVRWTGGITPTQSGLYKFATRTDDGVRVYVNGESMITNWSDHSATWNYSQQVALEAGVTYAITVEFYENGGDAVMELYWSGPGFAQQIVSTAVLSPERVYQLTARKPDPPDGATGASMPLVMWTPGETAMWHDVYFGTTPDLGPDQFQSRQMHTVYFHLLPVEPGTTCYWRVDEVEVDGTTIHPGPVWSFTMAPVSAFNPLPRNGDKWIDPNVTLSWAGGQGASSHVIYFDTSRDAVANRVAGAKKATEVVASYPIGILAADTTYYWAVDEITEAGVTNSGSVWSFTTMGTGGGAKGEYFGGTVPAGLPALSRLEPALDFTWGTDGPGTPIPTDNFSARWTADLEIAVTDTYTFVAISDDGVRVWLDDTLIIENWTDHSATDDFSVPIKLNANTTHSLRMEYYDATGTATAQLAWLTPVLPRQALAAGPLQPPVKARALNPLPDSVDVSQTVTLTWAPGEKAAKHNVYFGEDAEAVASATTATSGIYRGQQALEATTFQPPTLEWNKKYFWRVDEINPAEADSPWPGGVWAFTTADFIVVDNFEAYNDDEGKNTRIYETWIDGYSDGLSGSTVGNMDPPFAEQQIVHTGRQSMPMDYNNINTPFYSQAYREFTPVQDWTVNGVTDLLLWVQGYQAPVAPVAEVGGKMTVSGEGTDIWDVADQFTFVFKALNGNGVLSARVTSNGTGSNTWAKGGVMIRDDLTPGSAQASMDMTGGATAGNGYSFQWRPIADAASSNADGTAPALQPPYYVKIERQGETMTGSVSSDGTNWTAVGTPQYVGMMNPTYIGICVSSHVAGEYRAFEFDKITVTGASGAWQTKEIGLTRNSTQNLYVIVEDNNGKTARATDATAVNAVKWTEWKIPLSSLTGVSLNKVKKLYLGVGDPQNAVPDGTGRIFIDDIRVVKPAPAPQP